MFKFHYMFNVIVKLFHIFLHPILLLYFHVSLNFLNFIYLYGPTHMAKSVFVHEKFDFFSFRCIYVYRFIFSIFNPNIFIMIFI